MGCNSTDILGTAYRNGYAKLSARDLKVAAIAAACSTCNAQPLIEAAVGLGYFKLTEYEVAECIATAICSAPGASGAPAPTILATAMQNHLSSMSRRDLDAVITALLCKQTNPPCVTPSSQFQLRLTSARAPDPNTQLALTWLQLPNAGSIITGYIVYWGTTSGVYTNNSGTIPANPHSYIITGLTSGTTYYVAVQATTAISGCVSATSAEISASTSGSPPGNHLLNGLISYWQLENPTGTDAKDGNTLTISGGTIQLGLIGNCFSGNGSFAITPTPANLQLGAAKSFTISAWFNGAGGASQEGVIGVFNNNAAQSAWLIYMPAGTSNLQLGGFTGGVQATIANFGVLSAAWHHLVFGFDSPNQRLFAYFDNGAIQTQGTTGDLNTGALAFFGAKSLTGQAAYLGSIDETGYWNKVLSAADVNNLFNAGAGLPFASFTA